MKLLKEQVREIKSQLQQLDRKLDSNIESLSQRENFCPGRDCFGYSNDITVEPERVDRDNNLQKIKDLESYLNGCEQVKVINNNKIEVGTKFNINAPGFEDDAYILVDVIVGSYQSRNGEYYVSTGTPFGKAVQGLKVNDKFSFITPNGTTSGYVSHITPQVICKPAFRGKIR